MGGETLQSLALSLSEERAENERLTSDNAHLAGKLAVMMQAMGFTKDDDLLREAVERIQVLAAAERQRDEALAALKASEERGKGLLRSWHPRDSGQSLTARGQLDGSSSR